MPLTPFHLGPGLLLGLLAFPILDLPTILVASVIVDVEPFLVLTLGLKAPLHGFLHTYLGGSLVAAALTAAMTVVRGRLDGLMEALRLKQDHSLRSIALSSFLGIYLHILLDSIMHMDMAPLYPLRWNPMLGAIPMIELHMICITSGFLGLTLYVFKAVKQMFERR